MPRQLITVDPSYAAASRSCGTCNMCCTTHAVSEIQKPRCVSCANLNALGRCDTYQERPQSCRDYECLWRSGNLPIHLKPNVVRAVIEPNGDGTMLVAHVLPQDRGAHRRGRLKDFIENISRRLPVIIVCGDERIIIGARDEDVQVIGANIAQDGSVVQEVLKPRS